ncbi:hypothetical protein KAH43_03120 [Candidatus Bipolaricaulota bacterium]|nr:hypothetical protein [Candidatus Bipolaricaulota bacterium]
MAKTIAKTAKAKGLSENYIVPTMIETGVFINEAVDVSMKAIEQEIARCILTADKLRAEAASKILHAQAETKVLTDVSAIFGDQRASQNEQQDRLSSHALNRFLC